WFPEHRFVLCGDGAFASLAAVGMARTQVVSRMRRDAALYEPAPPRTGKRGRPRKKGERLPSLQALAAQASWERHELDLRGEKVTRLVLRPSCAVVPDVAGAPGVGRHRARPRRPPDRRLLLHDRPLGETILGCRDLR